MQFHLVKCKKNYPDTNLQECIYNSVHKIPEPEMKVGTKQAIPNLFYMFFFLQFHLENCPDRHKLDRFYFKKEDRESSNSFNRFPIQNIKVETEECWDNVNEYRFEGLLTFVPCIFSYRYVCRRMIQ